MVPNEFCWMIGRLPEQTPLVGPCARIVPKNAPAFGASSVTLIENSPFLSDEKKCPGPVPCTGIVPVNVSVTLLDGSTRLLQLTVRRAAAPRVAANFHRIRRS